MGSKQTTKHRNKNKNQKGTKKGESKAGSASSSISAVDYHTIIAFLRVLVPALEDCAESENVQSDGLRVLAGICGSGDERYPPAGCDFRAPLSVRVGIHTHLRTSERVCYEGVRSFGFLALSVEPGHREVKVIDEGGAIVSTLQAMHVHLTSRRVQREGCITMMQLGLENANNALMLADLGFGTGVAAALRAHPESMALAVAAAECVVGLCNAVCDPCEIDLKDIDVGDMIEAGSREAAAAKSAGKAVGGEGKKRAEPVQRRRKALTPGELKRLQREKRKRMRRLRDEFMKLAVEKSYLSSETLDPEGHAAPSTDAGSSGSINEGKKPFLGNERKTSLGGKRAGNSVTEEGKGGSDGTTDEGKESKDATTVTVMDITSVGVKKQDNSAFASSAEAKRETLILGAVPSSPEEKIKEASSKITDDAVATAAPPNQLAKRVGLIECLLGGLNKYGRSSPVMMEEGCRALRLLATKRQHGFIVCANRGEDAAVDAISSVLEVPRDSDDEDGNKDPEMIYVDGKLVPKGEDIRPPRIRTTKIKKETREARVAEEAMGLLVRLCYVGEVERMAVADAGGIAACCALLKVAGPNRNVHELCLLLIGMLGATNGSCRDLIFEEDAADLICASMKRYNSDALIAQFGCWAIACSSFSHGSQQTSFAMGGGLEAARKARAKFKSKTKEEHAAVRAWSSVAEKAILGRKVSLECGWWKPEYTEEEDDEDSDAGLPGFRPKVYIKGWVVDCVTNSLQDWKDRYLGAVGVQKISRGFLVRPKSKKRGRSRGKKKGKKGKKGKRGSSRGSSRQSKRGGKSKSPSKDKGKEGTGGVKNDKARGRSKERGKGKERGKSKDRGKGKSKSPSKKTKKKKSAGKSKKKMRKIKSSRK